MGQKTIKQAYQSTDYHVFQLQLQQELHQLEQLIQTPKWGEGEHSIGAELETYITDQNQRPAHLNKVLLAAANDPQLTLEVNQFNLEYNCCPQSLIGQGLNQLEQELNQKMTGLQAIANQHQCRLTNIGILPTLTQRDFGLHAMTDEVRYHHLTNKLRELRGGPFQIWINGVDKLMMTADDMTLEGANTSFQFHFRVNPNQFAAWHNAIQLTMPFVMALAVNSPTFLGKKLWQETRIPLFKQSIDSRNICVNQWKQPSRVTYGTGWLRKSAIELFHQSAYLHPVILPEWQQPETHHPLMPPLPALKLQQGTTWNWNRAVYDHHCGGHLRIELRALPAGPTIADMIANAAFAIGLAQSFVADIENWCDRLPFDYAEHNFYRAAQYGLDANFIWPSKNQPLAEHSVNTLLSNMPEKAHRGLIQLGVEQAVADRYMRIIESRLATQRTGASWQLNTLEQLEKKYCKSKALEQLTRHYNQFADSGLCVSDWGTV